MERIETDTDMTNENWHCIVLYVYRQLGIGATISKRCDTMYWSHGQTSMQVWWEGRKQLNDEIEEEEITDGPILG